VSWRALVTLAILGLVLSPLARSPTWDSFPVSSYPMFSRGDLGSVATLAHVVLVGENGERRPAPPSAIGTPEPMIAGAIIVTHVERGTSAELCAVVAARIRGTATAVEVVRSTFDTERYFRVDRTPVAREVLARCEVQ
jgi:hypothetical protein